MSDVPCNVCRSRACDCTIAVVRIQTGRVIYCGTIEATAAVYLEPGTCFGKGHSRAEAERVAQQWATVFRDTVYKAA